MTRFSKIIALGFVGLTVAGMIWLFLALAGSRNKLPILGEPGHVTGDFSFMNQHGENITRKNLEDKVVVVEYFFTSCPGICKVMNKNLMEIYENFKGQKDFLILSHTVDPDTDSVAKLATYANMIGATEPSWQFLTGDKTALYNAAKNDYLLSVESHPESIVEDEFIHTEYVALLDRQHRIRGFYDATDSLKMDRLAGDIRKLLEE